jgi:hypothetical protein
MARLRQEHLMVAREMVGRDVPVRQVALSLGADQSTLRYHLARPEAAPDGRRERASVLNGWTERMTAVLQRFADPRVGGWAMDRVEASVVHGAPRRAFGFTGRFQSIWRHLVWSDDRRHDGRPRRHAGVAAPQGLLGGVRRDLLKHVTGFDHCEYFVCCV